MLGFVAVCSALLAPVTLLAEDVRTGKLGGLCSLGALAANADELGSSGSDDANAGAAHCDMCGSSGLGLPPLQRQAEVFPATISAIAVVFQDALRSASSLGLPFSRGPPAL